MSVYLNSLRNRTARRKTALAAQAALSALSLLAGIAHAAPLDFDNEGKSEILSVAINGDSTLSWTRFNSGDSSVVDMGTLGVNGNHLAPANWRTGAGPQRVVISQNATTGTISWTLDGEPTPLLFGSGAAFVMGGGDFDGSGLSDAVVVKRRNGKHIWQVVYDPFASDVSDANKSAEIEFGTLAEIPFFVSNDGISDRLALLVKSGRMKFRSVASETVSSVALDRKIANLGRPVPVSQPSTADLLAFSKATAGQTTFTIVNQAGRKLRSIAVAGTGTVVVGEFDTAAAGEELAVQGSTNFAVVNPTTQAQSTLAVDAEIPVDEVNVNFFNGGDLPGIEQCDILRAPDGRGNFVWKPQSDTVGKAVAVLPGNLTNRTLRVETFKADGTRIKQLQLTGCGNPFPTIRCNYKDFVLDGARYEQIHGAISIKVSYRGGGCGRFDIPRPSRRVD